VVEREGGGYNVGGENEDQRFGNIKVKKGRDHAWQASCEPKAIHWPLKQFRGGMTAWKREGTSIKPRGGGGRLVPNKNLEKREMSKKHPISGKLKGKLKVKIKDRKRWLIETSCRNGRRTCAEERQTFSGGSYLVSTKKSEKRK